MKINVNYEEMNLKMLRKIQDVTIKKICEHVKISPKTYCDYEKNPKNFTLDQIIEICKLLEIDVNDFIKLKGA